MQLTDTPISGLQVAETELRIDLRGSFKRCFCTSDLADAVFPRNIVQINHSCTVQIGAIRGMHFQYPPCAEMKMVRCLRGRVFDVAVDLRRGSPTFLEWHAEELSAHNSRMFIIPEGFAHGFQVLEASSELLYLHTAPYNPSAEGGIRHDDPTIGIDWPLKTTDLSLRDQQHPLLNDDFEGLAL